MRRRLDLASALVHEPEVLFLDEPTTGLDPVSRKAIWEEVAKLNAEGTTVFLTTQYLEEADQLADRVGIIDAGKIVAEGTPASLKAEVGRAAPRARARRRRRPSAPRRSLAPFGKPLPAKDGTVLVELEHGAADVAAVVRALDEAGIAGRVARPGRSPPSTTSSSPRPATTSRATTQPEADAEETRCRRRRSRTRR